MVARSTDAKPVARAQRAVDERRSAVSVRLTQNRDPRPVTALPHLSAMSSHGRGRTMDHRGPCPEGGCASSKWQLVHTSCAAPAGLPGGRLRKTGHWRSRRAVSCSGSFLVPHPANQTYRQPCRPLYWSGIQRTAPEKASPGHDYALPAPVRPLGPGIGPKRASAQTASNTLNHLLSHRSEGLELPRAPPDSKPTSSGFSPFRQS